MLATLSTTRTDDLLAAGESTASALTGGYHLAFTLGAGLVAVAIGVAVAVLRPAPAAEVEAPNRRASRRSLTPRPPDPRRLRSVSCRLLAASTVVPLLLVLAAPAAALEQRLIRVRRRRE